MDVRKKLVELLGNIYLPIMAGPDVIGEYRIPYKLKEEIADHLITNGVTVQEWISVKDRLPEEDGTYLTALNHHFGAHQGVSIRKFAKDGETVDEYELAGQKYVWYFYDIEYGYVPTDSVTHWMTMPQPPKGE